MSGSPAGGGRAAPVELPPEVAEVLLTEEMIQDKIRELAKRITDDYRDRDLLLVGVLKGAFILMSDLAREIALPLEFDFMAVSSYGSKASRYRRDSWLATGWTTGRSTATSRTSPSCGRIRRTPGKPHSGIPKGWRRDGEEVRRREPTSPARILGGVGALTPC